MVWFNVDDGFWSHPKVLELDAPAVALWVRAGSYCAKHLTDGKVTHRTLRILDGDHDAATSLVLAGLWVFDDSENCWWFHDWSRYQRTREQVEAERAATRERVAKHREKQRTNDVGNAVTNGGGTPAQSSPVQTNDFYSLSKSQSSSNRARVSTDAIHVPEMTRKLAARRGVSNLRSVVDAIVRHTGVTVDANGALQVALWILDKPSTAPSAPQRYVTGAIAKSPLEVQQFIHENALEVAS